VGFERWLFRRRDGKEDFTMWGGYEGQRMVVVGDGIGGGRVMTGWGWSPLPLCPSLSA
jgi:hypothetical protein